jgi:hypothetical protein
VVGSSNKERWILPKEEGVAFALIGLLGGCQRLIYSRKREGRKAGAGCGRLPQEVMSFANLAAAALAGWAPGLSS